MKFTKLQGAGNDFLLVETEDIGRDWPSLAKTVCDRHFGVGADGLLLLSSSETADFKMRIYNADGSEAEACGNGIRCLAKYVIERDMIPVDRSKDEPVPSTRQLVVETIVGNRTVWIHQTEGGETRIQFAMGVPVFTLEDIPVTVTPGDGKLVDISTMSSYSVTVDSKELRLNFISMGNPHAVYFWQQPVADFPLARIGPEVEYMPLFPKRTNFEVAQVIGRNLIDVVVWERGVGETLACGTGACAVAVAAQLYGYVDRIVDVKLPGGVLQVEWDGMGEVLLSGPAEVVFTGEWTDRG